MTEAGPVLTMCLTFAKEPIDGKPGACGTVVRNAEMKIVDPETDISLPRNQPGEICIRGDQIMKGTINIMSHVNVIHYSITPFTKQKNYHIQNLNKILYFGCSDNKTLYKLEHKAWSHTTA